MNRFDYIIAGGGTAGCVLACRLSRVPGQRVLLIEAGGAHQPFASRVPLLFNTLKKSRRASWGYVSEPEPGAGGRCFIRPHGKGLGGSSAINGMIAVRGHPADYDAWAALGLPGWSYQDVLPYFRRAESHWRREASEHGSEGPWTVTRGDRTDPFFQTLVATARATDRPVLEDFASGNQEGLGAPDFSIASGVRVSTATAYLSKAGPGLETMTDAHVTRILLEQGRAIGVEVSRDGVTQRMFADREVVLSAGGYNSAQLLMLSGIGDAETLKALGIVPQRHLPGVGQNLQGHVSAPLRYHAKGERGFHRELRLDRLALAAIRWALFRDGVMARVPLAALAYVRSRDDIERPDIQIMYSTGRMDDRPWLPGIWPGIGHFVSSSLCLCRPRSRGVVTLRSPSPFDAPRIRFNLLDHPEDIIVLRNAIRRERIFYGTRPLADWLADEDLPGTRYQSDAELDERLRETATSGQHPASTCAMGNGPDAVTDAELRVRGIRSLRVADASVMPLMASGNICATVIMIAEKAADLMLGKQAA